MIQLNCRSRTKNPTPTPMVVRNPTPPKNLLLRIWLRLHKPGGNAKMLPTVTFAFKCTVRLWFENEIGYYFTLCTAGSVSFSVVASIRVCRNKSCTAILKKFWLKILLIFLLCFHPQNRKIWHKWLDFNRVKAGRPEDKTTDKFSCLESWYWIGP